MTSDYEDLQESGAAEMHVKKKKTMVCETIGPIDNALSGMHEAEVQVFSDSVPCLGKQAMNMRTVH